MFRHQRMMFMCGSWRAAPHLHLLNWAGQIWPDVSGELSPCFPLSSDRLVLVRCAAGFSTDVSDVVDQCTGFSRCVKAFFIFRSLIVLKALERLAQTHTTHTLHYTHVNMTDTWSPFHPPLQKYIWSCSALLLLLRHRSDTDFLCAVGPEGITTPEEVFIRLSWTIILTHHEYEEIFYNSY